VNHRRLLIGGIIGVALAAITIVSAVAAFDGNSGAGGNGANGPGADDSQTVQRDMRRDLAGRLGVDIETVSIQSFEKVTWPDSCMGVHYPYAHALRRSQTALWALLLTPRAQYVYGSRYDFVAVLPGHG